MTALWVTLGGMASYMVLVGSFSIDELVAGAVLGTLGAVWHAAILHDGARRFIVEPAAARAIAGALIHLPGATLKVGARLVGALRGDVSGRHVEQAFHRGRVDDSRAAGRRAIVVLATSLAPDSYTLRLPLDEQVIAFHTLTGDRPSRDPRWPS